MNVVAPPPADGIDPLPPLPAAAALLRCVARTVQLAVLGRLRRPRAHLGVTMTFANGTTSAVYRETVAAVTPRDPVVLVVGFRLRRVRSPRVHRLFRLESVLNTVLFAGFPGFVSKLWFRHDDHGEYRGLYEWDGAESAERYVRALWWMLVLVSEPASIHRVIEPGLSRAELLAELPATAADAGPAGWWRPVAYGPCLPAAVPVQPAPVAPASHVEPVAV